MSYTALVNTPISVDLTKACNDTGWTVPGDGTAVHITCNAGFCTLISYPVKSGHTYQFTFAILSISSGFVQAFIGGTAGVGQTSPEIYVDTIKALADGFVQLYSTANCVVRGLNIKDVTLNDAVTKVWSAINKKWSDDRTIYPEFGFSLYTNSVLIYNGAVYLQQNGSDSRNNFFGQQYQSSIKFVGAKNAGAVNGYESLNYQANMLLVSTQDGIATSLGQVSTLIDTDFIKRKLSSAGVTVIGYDKDGVYSASFLPDSNEDAVNGSPLRGNYITIELITADGSTPLKLFSVEVKSAHTPVGAR